MRRRALVFAGTAAAVLAAAWAVRELALQLRALDVASLRIAIASLPLRDLAASLAFTMLSFAALGVLEVLASRAVLGRRIPVRRALHTGVVSHALCNTLGFHAVLAPALRLALYRGDGVDAWSVARMLAVVGASLVAGSAIAGVLAMASGSIGAGVLPVIVVAVALVALAQLLPRIAPWMPPRLTPLVPAIAVVAFIEAACAMAALFVLMPAPVRAMPAHFMLAFIGSAALGVVSHAPGGVGVFEAGMLAALPGGRARIVAALLVFRLVYNLLPASVAAITLACTAGRGPLSSMAGRRGSRDAVRGTAAPARACRSAGARGDGSHH